MSPNQYIATFVYAKCKDHLRRPLWNSMLQQSNTSLPWCTLGDFNVITDPEEKLEGVTYNMRKSLKFISTIEACGLQDLGFSGQKYTWSNLRGIMFKIWKRLDRDHPSFMEMVSRCWSRDTEGNPMWCFYQKMKRLSATLSSWSKLKFGDIYAKVKEYVEKSRQTKEELISVYNEECRTKLYSINAEYIRYLKMEEFMLKQKTQLQWFKEDDINSKYFHSLIRGRRRKLHIHSIQNEEGTWL
ncbi:uncharacterized protein LOC129903716 [Solanum dulcamara]|uniref:uncharacterized protein LOC129903716 n=1 Tax=Solanum dulcamara TaxID=45834 RepID=UPI0024852EAE|nr:uncharacterized protein LOC129903716 [Solanum dulcamara]